MFEKSYGTPMIFLELSKYWKNHMIPPMIFYKTIQQYNIFVWYSLKNIQIKTDWSGSATNQFYLV